MQQGMLQGMLIGMLAGGPLAIVAIVFGLIFIVIAIALFLILGVLGFIGIIFIGLAIYIFITKRGQVPIAMNSPAIICIIIGIFLILASMATSSLGMNIYPIDFSGVPGMPELHTFLNK